MYNYISNEVPYYYFDEIIESLGIDYDEDEEIVEGKRGCLTFVSDVYAIKYIIEEHLLYYRKQGKSLQEAVNHIVNSDEDKDYIFKMVRKCVDECMDACSNEE